MKQSFHRNNRAQYAAQMEPGAMLVLFAGTELRKTGDEYYPFFAHRDFLYLTGISQKQSILLMLKDGSGICEERLYILPKDPMAERWTGTRLTDAEASELSGISVVRPISLFASDFRQLAVSGRFAQLHLDLYRCSPEDQKRPADDFWAMVRENYPYLQIVDAKPAIRRLRTIKQPCEIEALREAEKITKAGILAMMHTARPGMYEYQLKAEFDRALGQFGPQGPGFPSIISAGRNNFCIHYYDYSGRAEDGDLILNDVGAQFDNHITDVSRSYPCSGRFSERQKLLYECALATSNHMFSIICPGMKMKDVDLTIRNFNEQLLREAGALRPEEDIRKLMWHGGAHHIGYDVHDEVAEVDEIAPGMVFCVDVGIYHEEWGIGFRLEDNCLVTASGCENLSAAIPRTIAEIEEEMTNR